MLRYTIKRFLFIIPLLLALIVLVFALINLVPGDPGRTILGLTASQEAVDALNEEMGYYDPFYEKLLAYLHDIFIEFDFGSSYTSGQPVLQEIFLNFKYTLRLTVLCTLCTVLVGIPLGVLAAVKQYSLYDNIARIVATTFNSMPSFWLSMIGILVFSLYLGLLPPEGVDGWKNYVLPVGINALTSGMSLLRMTRTIMLETIREDYVRTARAKGCSERTVNFRHAFANASLPIVNQLGLQFATMLGGMVIYENVFSMPGLGSLAMSAVNTKDMPMVMGTSIFFALIFSVVVILVDLCGAWMDPRIRAKFVRS